MTIKQLAQLSLLFTLSLTGVNAQLIKNQYGEAFTDQPFFNTKEIEENNIKTIQGCYTHYKLGEGLRKTKLYKAYHFNDKGQLIEQLESFIHEGDIDTIVTYYKYDSKQNLTSILTRGATEISQVLLTYDNQNRAVQEERRKLSLLTSEYSKTTFSATYSKGSNHQRKTIYDAEGKPFKYEDKVFNHEGQVVEVIERLENNGKGTKTTYFYNDQKLLDSLVKSSLISTEYEESYSFRYDENNNLVDKNYYQNGEEVQLQKMIYHLEERTLENVVIHQVSTNLTRILKIEDYIYFDG